MFLLSLKDCRNLCLPVFKYFLLSGLSKDFCKGEEVAHSGMDVEENLQSNETFNLTHLFLMPCKR